ncbi:MAG: hypothetical protein Kow00108_07120 [Calditrichia bacterium]
MIVKNEENFLRGCLESVKDFVDEMVIVDTGSSDQTISIAEEFGANIYHFEWQHDFSKARNYALSKANGQWVIWLDADERLPKIAHQGLKQLILSDKYDAIVLKLRSEVRGVLGNTPHYQQSPRIFRKMPGVEFEFPIHEQISPSLIRQNARFVMVDAVIEHLGYAQSDEVLEEKIERNIRLLKKHLEMDPHNAYAHYQYAQSIEIKGETEDSREHYLKAIQYDENNTIAPTVYLHLAAAEVKNKNHDKALEYALESIKRAPNQYTGYNIIAEINYFRKNYQVAAEHYEKALSVIQIPVEKRKLDIMIEKEPNREKMYLKYLSSLFYLNEDEKAAPIFMKMAETVDKLPMNFIDIATKSLKHLHVPLSDWKRVFARFQSYGEQPLQPAYFLVLSSEEHWLQIEEVRKWLIQHLSGFEEGQPELQISIAEKLFNSGDITRAYRLIGSVDLGRYGNESVLYFKGVCEIKLGLLNEAVSTFEQLCKKVPENMSYKKTLGGLYAKSGNMEKAAQILRLITA